MKDVYEEVGEYIVHGGVTALMKVLGEVADELISDLCDANSELKRHPAELKKKMGKLEYLVEDAEYLADIFQDVMSRISVEGTIWPEDEEDSAVKIVFECEDYWEDVS